MCRQVYRKSYAKNAGVPAQQTWPDFIFTNSEGLYVKTNTNKLTTLLRKWTLSLGVILVVALIVPATAISQSSIPVAHYSINEDSSPVFSTLIPDQAYVIKDNVNYKLYYAGNDFASINLAQSPDGITWTAYSGNPIMTDAQYHSDVKYYNTGFPGANSGTNPSVLMMNYRIWYQGLNGNSIGGWRYAESPDGINWYNRMPVTQFGAPVFSALTGTNYGIGDVVYSPGASNTGTDWTFRIYANVQWEDAIYGGKELVVMGFSSNGYDWTGYDPASAGYATPVFAGTLDTSQFDCDHIGWFKVTKNSPTDWQAFYSGGKGTTYQALNGIGYATSTDGINWTRRQTLFTSSDGVAWRSQSVWMPSVVKTGNSYQVFFIGSNNADIGGSDWIQWKLGRAILTPPAPQAVVTILPSTVRSGATALITLQAKDGSGNNLTTGGLAVAFSLTGGGTSSGTIGSVTDNGNGTYSATFTGTAAGTARTISATIEEGAINSILPTIIVTAGAASMSRSVVTISPSTVVSGSAAMLTLQTKDDAGNNLTTGGLAVAFSLTGGGTSSGAFGSVTDNGNGTYSATFTGTTAGTARTVSATIGGSFVISASPTIIVTVGTISLSQSIVTILPSTVASGSTGTITLQAKDGAGNSLRTGGLAVAFSLSGGGTSNGTIGNVTDNVNGTYEATFTGTTAGTARTVSATIGGSAVTSASPTITVVGGAASLSQSILMISSSTVRSGAVATITLRARDENGNDLTAGGLTVAFSLTGGGTSSGAIGGVTDNGDGTYSATFTGANAGTAKTISALIGASTVTSASPTITVIAGSVSMSQSIVTVAPSSLGSGSIAIVTLQAEDGAGNYLTTGGFAVTFSLTGGGASSGTIGSVTDNNNGTYSALITASTSGSPRTISAFIDGRAVTSASPTMTITAGAVSLSQSIITISPSTVGSGSTSIIMLQARDGSGNNLTTGGFTIAFSLAIGGSSSGSIGSVTDNGDGTYAALFTASTAGTPRTINATLGGSAVTSSSATITVIAGAVSLSQSIITVAPSSIRSGSAAMITLQAKDGAGNSLTTGGLAIVFLLSGGGTSGGTFGNVTDNGNGTYNATFTGTTAGTARTVSATIGGSAVTSASPTITVTTGAVSLSQSIITISPSTVGSGAVTAITLRTRDANGNDLTTGGLTVAFSLTGGGTSSGTIGEVTDNGNGTYTALFTASTAGTPRTINATLGGSAVTSASPTITVIAGAVSMSQSIVTILPSTVGSGSTGSITLQAKDGAGNSLTSGGLAVVFSLSGAGTSSGTIGNVTDNGNGTYNAAFTGHDSRDGKDGLGNDWGKCSDLCIADDHGNRRGSIDVSIHRHDLAVNSRVRVSSNDHPPGKGRCR